MSLGNVISSSPVRDIYLLAPLHWSHYRALETSRKRHEALIISMGSELRSKGEFEAADLPNFHTDTRRQTPVRRCHLSDVPPLTVLPVIA